jgi:hypothetical protein
MKLPRSEKDFEELMKGIKWNRIIPPMVSVLQPVIIFSLWLGFAKMDKRADAVAKLIALAEPLPFDIDLNVPQPVVLASLYHSVDEALDVLKEVIEYLEDIEIPSADKIVDDIKEDLKETLVDPVTEASHDFQTALKECTYSARNIPTITLKLLAIQACMLQKGFSLTTDYIKDKLF